MHARVEQARRVARREDAHRIRAAARAGDADDRPAVFDAAAIQRHQPAFDADLHALPKHAQRVRDELHRVRAAELAADAALCAAERVGRGDDPHAARLERPAHLRRQCVFPRRGKAVHLADHHDRDRSARLRHQRQKPVDGLTGIRRRDDAVPPRHRRLDRDVQRRVRIFPAGLFKNDHLQTPPC